MKIVHVEDFIHPDAGYQVNILSRLQVKQGHQVTIVCGELDKIPPLLTTFFGTDNIAARDEWFRREIGPRIIRIPLLGYFSGRAIMYPRVFKVVDELKPDVVMVHCADSLTGILFTLRASSLNYPLVFDTHSLEMASVNRFRRFFWSFYRHFIAPIVLKHDIPVIRVVDSDFVEKRLGIPLSRTTLLSFGTDTNYFQPDAAVRAAFRKEHAIADGAFVVLYAGKLDASKGGDFLADSITKIMRSQTGKEIVFIVVGNTDRGAYGETLEKVFAASENRVIRLPTQRYLDLAKLYQAADLAVYPKQCSLSFFEAHSVGLPVLFEVNEINSQRTDHGGCLTFEPGNTDDLRAKILSVIDMPPGDYAEMSRRARKFIVDHYDFVPVAARYSEVFAETVRKFKQQ